MKKLMKSVLAITLTLTLLVACGGSKGSTIKMGVASTQSVAETRDEDDDSVEFTVVVVGVALKDDKVAYIEIDESQQFAEGDGEKVSASALPTKKQRGDDYNMRPASPIGKEWDEQIIATEEDLIGKTLAEVEEYFAGEEILSSNTMYVDHIAATVVKAINSATEVKGVSKVGLGYHVTTQAGRDELSPETTLEYAMVAVDADGKIIEAKLDNAQEKAKYEAGEWTLVNVGQTKGELKEAYNMLPASPIGKEWYEQNDAMMEALKGLTFEEALGLKASEADLESSVTMIIDGIQASLAHAQENLQEIK